MFVKECTGAQSLQFKLWDELVLIVSEIVKHRFNEDAD